MLTFCIILWLVSLLYQVGAWICLRRFFALSPSLAATSGPGVTVFKPVKGWEPGMRECLESFLTQEYAPYEVLFGVADPQDPALQYLRELAAAHSGVPVKVVLCPEVRGLNPKVSILQQLAPLARYDLLVLADADVKVGGDFLATAAAALARPGMGLVSCPYRACEPRSLGAALESLAIAGDFIPSVAVARYVQGVDFALGAAMAFTRRAYEAIGGFAPLADYLADDYQLGHRISQAGFGVDLLPYVVETGAPDMCLKDYVLHQLRWSRTYRVCRPKGYLAYGITHTLLFALMGWWLSAGAGWAAMLVAATVGLRLGLSCYALKACLKGRLPGPAWMLVPVKDLLAVGFWLLSFLGNTVTWRGGRFRLLPDGRLTPMPAAPK
ncbi:MAG: bacteriohopanetetrol glucosamine biosynthesis glycosyltransferase HpnI [Desulfobaccales bacterium]